MKQRIIAIIAAAAMLALALCACGTGGNPPAGATQSSAAQDATTAAASEATTTAAASTTSAATAAAESKTVAQTADGATAEPVVLDLFVDISWLFDYFQCTPETRTGKVVLEKTGATINLIRAKTDDSSQINLLLASDDLPDFVCVGNNVGIFPALRESGKVMDFMPLIKSYAPELYDTMGEGYWNYFKSDTGINNYFAYSAFTPKNSGKISAFNAGNGGLFARGDIWDAMGGDDIDITTPEKFKAHMAAVKEKFPDTKPIMFSNITTLGLATTTHGVSFFKSMFGIEGYYETPDGKIMASYNHPEYANFLLWLNGMHRDGYYLREDLSATGEQRAALVGSGVVYMKYDSEINELAYPPAGHPDSRWTAAPLFNTSKMMKGGNLFWTATFISNKCKNPEAATKLMSFCASDEGDRLMAWGQEGIDYEYDANGAPARTKAYVDAHKDSVESVNYDNARGVIFGFSNWADSEFEILSMPNDEPWMKRARDLYQDYYYWRLNFMGIDPVGNMQESIIMQQCSDYFNEMIPQIVLAESESECLAMFETMKGELSKKGIAELEAYWTEQSDKRKEAFGADKMVVRGADNAMYHKLYG